MITLKETFDHRKNYFYCAFLHPIIFFDQNNENSDHHFNFNNYNQKYQFRSIDRQRNFMIDLFYKLKLKRMEEWTIVSRDQIIKNGGKSLICHYYSNSFPKLLKNIFPNYPWNSFYEKEFSLAYFRNSVENQRKFLDHLFDELKLKSVDQFLTISIRKFTKNGKNLLKIYRKDRRKMLERIYNDHIWYTKEELIGSIEKQKRSIDIIFRKLKLKKKIDWLKVKKKNFIKNGGKNLLEIYRGDMKEIFYVMYPTFPWRLKYQRTLDNFYYLQKQFLIKEKKDFYRMALKAKGIRTLKIIYPNEEWEWNLFNSRSKKSIQRLLFALTQSIFPALKMIENYRHPHLIYQLAPMEFDIFIPSLNIALEYQGEQHYNDIPGAFSYTEVYQQRDRYKLQLTEKFSVKLIEIPYWWDRSPHSLLSTLRLSIGEGF